MNTTIAFIAGFAVACAIGLLIATSLCRRNTKYDTELMDFLDSREATVLRGSDPKQDEWAVLVGRKIVTSGNDLRDVLTRAKRMVK